MLAVSGPARLPGVDAPTLTEAGFPVVFSNWRGVLAPPGISRTDQDRLVELLRRLEESPEWNAAVQRSGWRFNRAILEQAGITDLTSYDENGRTKYGVVRDELMRAGMVIDNRIPEDKRWLFFPLPPAGYNADTAGLPLFVEVRPMYLYLTEERLLGEEGPLFVGQPPLRSKDDSEALWNGIVDGAVDLIATDHAPWTRAEKLNPERSITDLRPGISSLQFMLPLFFWAGVKKRGISLERFVDITSTKTARIMGL